MHCILVEPGIPKMWCETQREHMKEAIGIALLTESPVPASVLALHPTHAESTHSTSDRPVDLESARQEFRVARQAARETVEAISDALDQ